MSKKKHKQKQNSEEPQKQNSKKTSAAITPFGSMISWLLVLVLLLPLFYTNQTSDPVIPVRFIVLCIFMLVFTGWFFLLRKNEDFLLVISRYKWIFIVAALSVAWNFVSMSAAINFTEGYFIQVRYLLDILLLIAVAATAFRKEDKLIAVCQAISITAFIQSIIGIFQQYNLGFENFLSPDGQVSGLMANRNLYGSAQAFMLPFLFYSIYDSKKNWRYFSIATLALTIVSLVISQTRSAWISAMLITIVAAVLVMIFAGNIKKKWLTNTGIGIAAAAAITALLYFGSPVIFNGGTTNKTETKDSLSRSAASVKERLVMWEKTVQMIKEHPFIGVGPGNWRINVRQYGSNDVSWADGVTVPTRSHNVYLEMIAERGVVGALLYFMVWVIILWTGLVALRKEVSEKKKILIILMLAGFAGFASDCFFSFPTERIEHSLYFMLMCGIILGLSLNEKETKLITAKTGPLAITALVIIAICLYIGMEKYNFENHVAYANAYKEKSMYSEMADESEKGKSSFVSLDMNAADPIELFGAIAYKELKQPDKALREIRKGIQYHPYSSRAFNTIGTIYTDLNQFDSAIVYYKKALDLSPRYETAKLNLAINYYKVNNYKECVNLLSTVDISKSSLKAYLSSILVDAKAKLGQ